MGNTRGRQVVRSSGDDLHQHGEDDERRGVGEPDSLCGFDKHGSRLLVRGRGRGTRGRRESRASDDGVHQHDENGQRRGVCESDPGGCFDEHGSSLLGKGPPVHPWPAWSAIIGDEKYNSIDIFLSYVLVLLNRCSRRDHPP